jgi:hypothetical protein
MKIISQSYKEQFMENIFTINWKSPNTWPIINSDGDILGSIAPDESTIDYVPVMVDKVSRQLYHEMTTNPDAYMAELDIE